MNKKLIFNAFFILFLICITSCSTVKYQITNSKNQNYLIYINNYEITGSVLSDTDKELVLKNIVFYIEKNQFLINEEDDSNNYKINFRLDVRPIGYNLFLMREVNNVFIEIEVFSNSDEPLYKITANDKIFYSPHDFTNLRQIIGFNIYNTCLLIKNDINSKNKKSTK